MYMTYKELSAEQERPLDYKIEKAIDAIARGFSVSKHSCALAFSGGKDSTVLWDLIRRFLPEYAEMFYIIYGNTGVEYPESLQFARWLGKEWGGKRFKETKPLPLEKDGLKYEAQCEVLKYMVEHDRLGEILTHEGKLKRTDILDDLCPPEMMEDFRKRKLIWKKGTPKNYYWCSTWADG